MDRAARTSVLVVMTGAARLGSPSQTQPAFVMRWPRPKAAKQNVNTQRTGPADKMSKDHE
jgi:hypothetical protein